MDKLLVNGPAKLSGTVSISCSKNAYLPIMAGVLLTDEPLTLVDLPDLRDIKTMNKLLSQLGVIIKTEGNKTIYNSSSITSCEATYDLVKTMRASILVLGPLLARFNKATVSLPGGCAIGARPVDIHLHNFERMGVSIELDGGNVIAKTDGLQGRELVLSFASVGATENLMLGAVLADGKTTIKNAAREPEISDLANFLTALGAKITGQGTNEIVVEGVNKLHGGEYRAIGDRIEAATYIIAALATESEVEVTNFVPDHLGAVLTVLEDMGAKFEKSEKSIRVFPSKLNSATIDTAPYPGFPTDVQAQMMTLLGKVSGSSVLTEHIFENRFMHVPELNRMGAKITLRGPVALIEGECEYKAAPVMCTDLRASAALVLAALTAKGESEIRRIYHLDRGYEHLEKKLSALGADIKRISEKM